MTDANEREPHSLGEIIEALRSNSALGKSLHEAQIWERWPEIVGPVFMHHGMPIRLRDGVLRVAVTSPVWMHRMSYKKYEIVQKIASILGPDHVSDIFFTLVEDEAGEIPQNTP